MPLKSVQVAQPTFGRDHSLSRISHNRIVLKIVIIDMYE